MTFSQTNPRRRVAGVATGLFLGERVAPLGVVADGFVQLLQMTVLPYVTVSIIVSLGSLDVAEAQAARACAPGRRSLACWVRRARLRVPGPAGRSPRPRARRSSAPRWSRPPRPSISSISTFRPIPSTRWPTTSSRRWSSSRCSWASRSSASSARRCCSTCSASPARPSRGATRFVSRLTPYGIFALAANAAGTLRLDQTRAHRGLPGRLHRDGAAGRAVGAAGAGRGADADSVSGGARPDPRCADHRLHRRRPVHRAADPDRGVQDAAGALRRHRRAVRPALPDVDRAGVVQLSAHRQAAVAELHHVRRLVRRLAGARCTTIRGSRSPDC